MSYNTAHCRVCTNSIISKVNNHLERKNFGCKLNNLVRQVFFSLLKMKIYLAIVSFLVSLSVLRSLLGCFAALWWDAEQEWASVTCHWLSLKWAMPLFFFSVHVSWHMCGTCVCCSIQRIVMQVAILLVLYVLWPHRFISFQLISSFAMSAVCIY